MAAFALAITFAVGAVVGVVGDRMVLLHMGIPQRTPEFLVRRLDHRLHLNDQQRTQITEIIGRHQQKIVVIWTSVRPSVRHEIDVANVEIDRVLTPEQRVEFDKIRMRLMPRRTGDGIRLKHD